ncbi:MAG: hypothetical protein QG650_909 [Patescibacteria group bacterium]|nr:hypothetical protein [Patescibacteria group bacterium]
MAIAKSSFVLRSRRTLTNDVFELVFDNASNLSSKAGEYVIFDAAPGVKRAYSIAFRNESGGFGFVIKRVPDGAGSPVICDLPIGAEISGMGPMGHFVLRETDVAKCFIGTGTGFAPLYYQLLDSSNRGYRSKMAFVFGVRSDEDVFYEKESAELAARFPDFVSRRYLSRVEKPGFEKGYVTDFLTPENVSQYAEFYLC